MPPASPDAIARKLIEMLKRRRPELEAVLDEMSKNREGQRELARAFSQAYEVYLKSLRLEEAFDFLVKYLETAYDDYSELD
ncbi:hypothetical protein ASAC_0205 [Acidilobus saccharovorans 345-15]|uniref:Uncharacterized protein n=1 Tax=Acidilobus saccharovorans (strain DSM 16705 / JCM 18335 / VKM B-2471 / 345-15) TaxID=666510 RepID=D9PZX4_ACIS3|nr:hypothetical protein [Acidilobus saccharovorans]ADL18612.1 hypothetical protein ASAC_0205 [Acidilobus saccharovorans 345-15]